jgi:hypothetical protein
MGAGDGETKPQRIKKGDVLGRVSLVVQLDEEDDADEWNLLRMENELNIGNHLLEGEKDRVLSMLTRVRTALSKTDSDIGRAHVTPQTIELTNNTPIYQKL